jgi:hypothetical protein
MIRRPSVPRRSLVHPLRAAGVAVGAWLALACGGLAPPDVTAGDPDPGTATGGGDGAAEVQPEPVPELPTPADPAPATSDPLSVFPEALDAGEAPPENGNPTCPAATSVIRYPRPNGLEVYCATTQGMKSGPWYRVAGNRVAELRTYEGGKQIGRAVRWQRSGSNPPVKVAEETWAAGELEGPVAEWNDSGLLMLRGQHTAGKRNGKFLLRSPAQPETFDGRCFEAGTEKWATADAGEFVSKPCP